RRSAMWVIAQPLSRPSWTSALVYSAVALLTLAEPPLLLAQEGEVAPGTLLQGDPVRGDRFGWSVSIDGDTAVVGAYFKGAVYVYVRDSSDQGLWTQMAKLTPSD